MTNSDIELMEILISRLADETSGADGMQDMYGSDWDCSRFLERVDEIRTEMRVVMDRILSGTKE